MSQQTRKNVYKEVKNVLHNEMGITKEEGL